MGRPLDLVGERDGVIREGDPALPVRICEKLIGPKPELAGALPLDEQGRRRDEGPVQPLFLPQQVEKGRTRLRLSLVLSRKTGSCHQLDARSDLQTAGPADDEVTADLGVLGRADQLERVAGQEVHGTHGDVVPAHNLARAGWSSTSPLVGVTFGRTAIFSGLRAMAVTAWPRRDSSLVISDPARPEAPATAIFMEGSFARSNQR